MMDSRSALPLLFGRLPRASCEMASLSFELVNVSLAKLHRYGILILTTIGCKTHAFPFLDRGNA
jgi:hypothetical protein